MGPILYLINRNSPYYQYYGLYDGKGLFKLQNCSWYVYGAILQQGEYAEGRGSCGRGSVLVFTITKKGSQGPEVKYIKRR